MGAAHRRWAESPLPRRRQSRRPSQKPGQHPGEAAATRRQCKLRPVEAEEPFVLDNPDTPTLVLNGTRDPATPLPYGKRVADKLATAYVVTVPGSGHGSLLNIACSNQIVLAFLADPRQAPDTSCLAERQPPFAYP
ncbi:MAG: hypothetical protein HGA45_37485 [Chloroflexales bacterium]|nr:hypothetical protein [Chloroflexales bacterium]